MMSDNELIAIFMEQRNTWRNGVDGFYKYDTSWDWLMPVVEKIEAKEWTLVNIYSDATKIWVDNKYGDELFATTEHGNKDHKIGHVYRAVVEFIKWYNQQQS